ncbi:AraC family transcriptional regulator [Lacinutrix venerupis]|uniref:helix-turn-helix domain-containing protein n=1 Tax=Lacinutrix venerupis TaxID=1486034 RepID=UPI000EB27D14|nr:helix-turn-helix domain-containing protein [Lacinutrix venerupis]RLJ64535.1 AraC family transcriptional regulator [Lacinutrix venerupis]
MNLENLNFNIFNILIISGVIHGVIFSFYVFAQDKIIKKSTIYLALTVLFLSLSNFQYWLIDTSITNQYIFLKYIFIPWHWLVLPMFYLYVYKLTCKEKITLVKNVLLFTPFVIVLLVHILNIYYRISTDDINKINSHFERGIYVYLEFASFIFNLLLMFLSHKMIKQYENNLSYDIKWVKTETNWLKKLIYLGILVCICWLIAISIITIHNINNTYFFYPMWIGNSILVYWIGYAGLAKSKQLKERILIREKRIKKISSDKTKKTKTFKNLEEEIISSKLYLNPNLNLKLLSKQLDLSEGYISQQINSNSKFNFNDYINNLRVEKAKQFLKDPLFDNYTIVAVGLESGFNSKSSFYTAFKKFSNKTPAQFKKDVRNL